jgi:hypothetical protein
VLAVRDPSWDGIPSHWRDAQYRRFVSPRPGLTMLRGGKSAGPVSGPDLAGTRACWGAGRTEKSGGPRRRRRRRMFATPGVCGTMLDGDAPLGKSLVNVSFLSHPPNYDTSTSLWHCWSGTSRGSPRSPRANLGMPLECTGNGRHATLLNRESYRNLALSNIVQRSPCYFD